MNELAPDWDPAEPRGVPARIKQMAEMRAKCPVAYTRRSGGYYALLKYDDIVAAAREPDSFSNAGASRYENPLPPLEYDPPDHGVYRRILQPFFAPPRIRALETRVRASAIALLEPLLEAGGGDFAESYSYPLPVLGLCALLGIPGSDWSDIKAWSEHTLLRDSDNPAERARADSGHERILVYARALIAERRANPLPPEDDVASALIAARPNGEQFDDDFIARALRILISAGHNSTTSAIGNSLLHLAQNQEDQARLRADASLIPTAVEEFLRCDTPVQEMPRWTTKDVVIRSRAVPQGARIGMFWASGNRDEDAFENAQRCIVERRPNRHLAFGSGIHTCLGAPMARMEIRVALEEMLARTARFEIAGEVVRAEFHRMGVVALPLRLTPR
jgi:cytochrome P450